MHWRFFPPYHSLPPHHKPPEAWLGFEQQHYQRHVLRTRWCGVTPLGTPWQCGWKKASVLPRTGEGQGTVSKDMGLSFFARQLESPCLAAEQRVWLMKRCQDDNPYYQETLDGDFFLFFANWGGGWGGGRKRIIKQKGTQEKEMFWRKNSNFLYIYICIYFYIYI